MRLKNQDNASFLGILLMQVVSFEKVFIIGIIHLVPTQNFLKNLYFLPFETHLYVCLSGGKKC